MKMAGRKLNFTKKSLEALEASETGPVEIADLGCKGLHVIVQVTGTKSFYYRGVVSGRKEGSKRYKLGTFPDMELADARTKADEMRIMASKGLDPLGPVKVKQGVPSLDDFFQQYLTDHAKKQKKTWDYDERLYRLHLTKRMGKMRLTDIKREHVALMHAEVGNGSGKSMANHVLALLTAVLNKAIEWEICPEDTRPTRHVKKYPTPSRTRRLDADEMQRVLNALMEEVNSDLRDYTLIGLFTGVRRSNVLAMRWDQIDWKSAVWNIPLTKNGEGTSVPLGELLMALLKGRKQISESEFVFPSDSRTGRLHEVRKSWASCMKRAKVTNFRPHDLRHTFATWLGKTGASGFVISKSLGQKDLKSATVYTHLNVSDVSKSSQTAVLEMLGTLEEEIDEKNHGQKP